MEFCFQIDTFIHSKVQIHHGSEIEMSTYWILVNKIGFVGRKLWIGKMKLKTKWKMWMVHEYKSRWRIGRLHITGQDSKLTFHTATSFIYNIQLTKVTLPQQLKCSLAVFILQNRKFKTIIRTKIATREPCDKNYGRDHHKIILKSVFSCNLLLLQWQRLENSWSQSCILALTSSSASHWIFWQYTLGCT